MEESVDHRVVPFHSAMPRRRPPAESAAAPGKSGERLQKVLAAAGHGSRRSCEELIVAGRVEVDGEIADELGTRVDPQRQEVRVDGVPLPRTKLVYYLLNKPTGVVSTNYDQAGRTRVIDLLPDAQRLFTVGRLDMSSEGLILATNDGDLANRLAHPRYGVEKVYHVEVAGRPQPEHVGQLRRGVRLAEAMVRAESVRVKKRRPHSTVLEITLREGRNREICRMLASVGHKVLRLKRVAIGPLRLGDLPLGAFRELTRQELTKLRRSAGARPKKQKPRRSSRWGKHHVSTGRGKNSS